MPLFKGHKEVTPLFNTRSGAKSILFLGGEVEAPPRCTKARYERSLTALLGCNDANEVAGAGDMAAVATEGISLSECQLTIGRLFGMLLDSGKEEERPTDVVIYTYSGNDSY